MIAIDTSALALSVTTLRQAAQDIASELSLLDSRSRSLASSWSGDAQLAYADAHRRWSQSLDELRELLDNAGKVVDQAQERYETTEQRVAASWRL